jgi:hypothetical protein
MHYAITPSCKVPTIHHCSCDGICWTIQCIILHCTVFDIKMIQQSTNLYFDEYLKLKDNSIKLKEAYNQIKIKFDA